MIVNRITQGLTGQARRKKFLFSKPPLIAVVCHQKLPQPSRRVLLHLETDSPEVLRLNRMILQWSG